MTGWKIYPSPMPARHPRVHAAASLLALGILCQIAACRDGGSADFAMPATPPLAAPSGHVLRVATTPELQQAARDLQSDTAIVLQPGRYVLQEPLRIGQRDPAAALTNVAVRGAGGNRDDVVIEGAGLEIAHVTGVLVADLTVINSAGPALLLAGESASRPHIYNVRFADAPGTLLRAGAGAEGSPGVADGVVEYSLFELTSVSRDRAATGGIAVAGGRNWIVRYNVFRNLRGGPAAAQQHRPAVAMRDRSEGAQVHNNLFVDCARGIAYGMAQADGPPDNRAGAIFNNFIYRRRGLSGDAGIMLWGSPGTQVHHNTVIQNGTYQRSIEYRFRSTAAADIRNNLTDGPIEGRDGAQAVVVGNFMAATLAMFQNPRVGDLRLTPTAQQAIDRGVLGSPRPFDWDGEVRPAGSRPDIGADEHAAAAKRP
jgi:hypothetical protein